MIFRYDQDNDIDLSNDFIGLILKLAANRVTTYVASKITIEKEDLNITIPKGKTITKKNYQNAMESGICSILLVKKREEAKEKN